MTTTAVPEATPIPVAPAAIPQRTVRLVSLDALRGFDMFWIIGAEEVVHGLAKAFPNRWTNLASYQMDHSQWIGFRFYDLIFPMFIFIVGVSLVFSLTKALSTGGKAAAIRRVLIRGVVLYLLGIIFYGGLAMQFGYPYAHHSQAVPANVHGAFHRVISDIRFMGVLQRIAICYTVSGLVFYFFGRRTVAGVALGLLLLYCGLMSFVRAPGQERVSFDEGKNLANWIDARYLPGFKWDGDHDPEGLLSTLPAIAGCLIGVLTGMLLQETKYGPYTKVLMLIVGGAILTGIGYSWGFQFPVIKKLWTSSFVFVTAGCSAMLLGIFYLIIDVWKFRVWARPFVWIGMNAITLYIIWNLFDLTGKAQRITGGPHSELANHVSARYVELAPHVLALIFILILARFMYKRQIFLRV